MFLYKICSFLLGSRAKVFFQYRMKILMNELWTIMVVLVWPIFGWRLSNDFLVSFLLSYILDVIFYDQMKGMLNPFFCIRSQFVVELGLLIYFCVFVRIMSVISCSLLCEYIFPVLSLFLECSFIFCSNLCSLDNPLHRNDFLCHGLQILNFLKYSGSLLIIEVSFGMGSSH